VEVSIACRVGEIIAEEMFISPKAARPLSDEGIESVELLEGAEDRIDIVGWRRRIALFESEV
jgi:hypothetical protein